MNDPFYTIKGPTGYLIHTHISLTPEEAIEEFLETERAMGMLANCVRMSRGNDPVCPQSWELYEAEGYCVVPVQISEVLVQP